LAPGTYASDPDPFADLVTADGARLWSALVIEDADEAEFGTAAEDFEALADRRDDASTSTPTLGSPDGFRATLLAGRQPVPIRRADGIHLCPRAKSRY
jgi:hypothetical protein